MLVSVVIATFMLQACLAFTFTSPTRSVTWRIGSTYVISWTVGEIKIDVPNDIVLRFAESVVDTAANLIVAHIPADTKQFKWTVPNDLKPGSNYVIQVTSGDKQFSSEPFTIAEPTDTEMNLTSA